LSAKGLAFVETSPPENWDSAENGDVMGFTMISWNFIVIKNKEYTGWCFQTIVNICNNFNHSSQVWLKHVETQFNKYQKLPTS